MKSYTIETEKIIKGIQVSAEPYPHIGVGEKGRGRRYYRFPVVPDLFESLEDGRLHRATVIKTRAKGTLLAVPEKDPEDRRALVLLNVEMGFRGGVSYTAGEPVQAKCNYIGERIPLSPYLPEEKCISCGVVYERHGDYFVHPDIEEFRRAGYVRFFPSPNGGEMDDFDIHMWKPIEKRLPQILATGNHAQGLAGRSGRGDNHLIIMTPGQTVRAVREGRLYGEPDELFIHWDGQEMKMGEKDEIFSPFEETKGETV